MVQVFFHDVCIPVDVIRDLVMQTIEEHHLLQLTGKRRRPPPSDEPKRPRIQYDYKRAEVMSDWVGVAPRFPDMQFERTFRIKHHMVDSILNHLANRDSFWIKTVCRAGKDTINSYGQASVRPQDDMLWSFWQCISQLPSIQRTNKPPLFTSLC